VRHPPAPSVLRPGRGLFRGFQDGRHHRAQHGVAEQAAAAAPAHVKELRAVGMGLARQWDREAHRLPWMRWRATSELPEDVWLFKLLDGWKGAAGRGHQPMQRFALIWTERVPMDMVLPQKGRL